MKLFSEDLEGQLRWWFLRTAEINKYSFHSEAVTRITYDALYSCVHGAFVGYENYIKIGFEI